MTNRRIDAQTQYSHLPRSKFEDPSCPFYPEPLHYWTRFQLDVDTSSSRFLYEFVPSDLAYVVPEPAFMVSTQSKEKSDAMFRSWLKYRPILIFRLSSQTSEVPPNHARAWNALLAAEYLEQHKKDRDPGSQTKAREELRKDMLTFLGNNIGGSTDVDLSEHLEVSTAGCTWHGLPFDSLRPEYFEQILWELSEINFRFEFQALDRRGRRGTPHERDGNTHASLMACVPDGAFSTPSLVTANHGLASSSQRERAHYLFAMARVMSKWSWTNPASWIAKTNQLHWSADELEELEKEIASVYTQSFYDCFRRAAVLPRRLSIDAMNACPLVGKQHVPQLSPYLENRPTVIINAHSTLSES